MVAGWFVCLALLAACSPASPAGPLPPDPSVDPEAAECPATDIVSPSGSRLQLTGVWLSNNPGTYDILQRGSCIYWMASSLDIGSGPGHEWANVFTGTIGNDLSITGRWGDVPFNSQILHEDLANGLAALHIDFDDSGDVERPLLRGLGEWEGLALVLEELFPRPWTSKGPSAARRSATGLRRMVSATSSTASRSW